MGCPSGKRPAQEAGEGAQVQKKEDSEPVYRRRGAFPALWNL